MDSEIPVDGAAGLAYAIQMGYELQQLFKSADKNGDGRITKAEFIQGAIALGSSQADANAEAEKVFRIGFFF